MIPRPLSSKPVSPPLKQPRKLQRKREPRLPVKRLALPRHLSKPSHNSNSNSEVIASKANVETHVALAVKASELHANSELGPQLLTQTRWLLGQRSDPHAAIAATSGREQDDGPRRGSLIDILELASVSARSAMVLERLTGAPLLMRLQLLMLPLLRLSRRRKQLPLRVLLTLLLLRRRPSRFLSMTTTSSLPLRHPQLSAHRSVLPTMARLWRALC